MQSNPLFARGENLKSLQCLFCREIVPIPNGGKIGDAARGHIQQCARNAKTAQQIGEWIAASMWIFDLLAFDSPDDPATWRALIASAINEVLVPHSLLEVVQ